jgi:hypothetical protein
LVTFCKSPQRKISRFTVAAAAVSSATVATIAAVANDVGSQQWQWWGQTTVAETEAAAGHTAINQQTGVDSGRNGVRGVRGGGSGDGGSRGSGSGDGGNGGNGGV